MGSVFITKRRQLDADKCFKSYDLETVPRLRFAHIRIRHCFMRANFLIRKYDMNGTSDTGVSSVQKHVHASHMTKNETNTF